MTSVSLWRIRLPRSERKSRGLDVPKLKTLKDSRSKELYGRSVLLCIGSIIKGMVKHVLKMLIPLLIQETLYNPV